MTSVTVHLSCDHNELVANVYVPVAYIGDDELTQMVGRRRDGWFSAFPCSVCGRKRAVLSLSVKGSLR